MYVDSAFAFLCIHHGLGCHARDLREKQLISLSKVRSPLISALKVTSNEKADTFTKALFMFDQTFIPAIAMIKMSVLQLYLRIFPVRFIKIGSSILTMTIMLWALVSHVMITLECVPPKKIWLKYLPGSCVPFDHILIGLGVPNLTTDIFLMLLPIKPICELHVTKARKLYISFVFLTGSLLVKSLT